MAQSTQWAIGLIGLAFSAAVLGTLETLLPDLFLVTALAFNAATFLGSAWFISRLPKLVPDRDHAEQRHFLRDVKEGMSTILGDAVLKVGIPLSLVVNLFMAAFIAIYAAVNREWFDGRYASFAGLELGFALPMAVTTLALGRVHFGQPGRWYVLGMAGLGLFVIAMGWAKDYWAFVALNAACGVVLPFAFLSMSTYQQLAVPNEKMGRVASAMNFATIGVQPLGLGLTSLFVDMVGITGILVAAGVGTLAGALIASTNRGFMTTPMPATATTTPAR